MARFRSPRRSTHLLAAMVDRPVHGGAIELAELKREALRTSCTTTRLRELRKHWSPTIRRLVAAHRNTSRTDVRYLLAGPDEWVRFHLAGRLDLTSYARWKLAGDSSMRVRRQLARTQDDPALLMALTADPHEAVRTAARYYGCWSRAFHDASWDQDACAERALTEWMTSAPDNEMRRLASLMVERVLRWGWGSLSEAPYRRLARGLARDPDPEIAMPTLRSIVRWGTEDDVSAMCADRTLPTRVGSDNWAQLRLLMAYVRVEANILRPLTRDPAAVIAAAALVNPACAKRDHKKAVRHDQYMRRVLRVMRGRLWKMRLIPAKPRSHQRGLRDDLQELKYMLSEISEVLVGDRWLSCQPGHDEIRWRLYDAEDAWSPSQRVRDTPILDAAQAQQVCRDALAHPFLRRRHPNAVDVAASLTVRFDRRIGNAGVAYPAVMKIRLNPKWADHKTLLHELAHLLTRANPRFGGWCPPLGDHGGAFASTMLDLVRVAHGRKACWRLRLEYLRYGVPVLRPSRRGRRHSTMSAARGYQDDLQIICTKSQHEGV